ncbi:MAG: hypothetical protein GEU95_01230 [Rhizobiales bacterium]|nr:hypothetical protein [Hyphomicrobiales bacterium]
MTALSKRHRIARQLREIDPTRRPGRKTNRTRSRAGVGATIETPTLRLVFRMPPSFMVPQGQHGVGIVVTSLGTAEIEMTTWSRDRLFEKAIAFLRKHAPRGMPPMSFAASYTSSSENHGSPMKWWLAMVDGHGFATVSPIGPLIFPAPAK